MRAATVAAGVGPGCARDFALAAYREAFVGAVTSATPR